VTLLHSLTKVLYIYIYIYININISYLGYQGKGHQKEEDQNIQDLMGSSHQRRSNVGNRILSSTEFPNFPSNKFPKSDRLILFCFRISGRDSF
jgi:hypothetical protein